MYHVIFCFALRGNDTRCAQTDINQTVTLLSATNVKTCQRASYNTFPIIDCSLTFVKVSLETLYNCQNNKKKSLFVVNSSICALRGYSVYQQQMCVFVCAYMFKYVLY